VSFDIKWGLISSLRVRIIDFFGLDFPALEYIVQDRQLKLIKRPRSIVKSSERMKTLKIIKLVSKNCQSNEALDKEAGSSSWSRDVTDEKHKRTKSADAFEVANIQRF